MEPLSAFSLRWVSQSTWYGSSTKPLITPGASELELDLDSRETNLSCSTWPQESVRVDTAVPKVTARYTGLGLVPPRRCGLRLLEPRDESISNHAQEGPFQMRPTARESARTSASLVACVKDPIVIFVDKAWKHFQGFRIERVGLRGMRSSFVGCVSAPRIRRSIVHHGQCQFHLDKKGTVAAPLNLILR